MNSEKKAKTYYQEKLPGNTKKKGENHVKKLS
jgi:hypothetical protein